MINWRLNTTIFLLTFFVLFSCNTKSGKRQSQPKNVTSIASSAKDKFNSSINPIPLFKVTKVVDGDTFWVNDGSERGIKIRLIGVDAPESKNAFKRRKEYYGKEATAYLTYLIGGKSVKLEFDINLIDQYGRTLAYVYLIDGTFINAELVKNGYALIKTIPPNIKYADDFAILQKIARENNRGLWNINNQ